MSFFWYYGQTIPLITIKRGFPMKLITLLLILSSLTGCATYISKNDCSKDNFYKKAKSSSYKGNKTSIFKDYRKACKKHGI